MGGDRRGKKKEHKKRERQTNGDWWTVRQKIAQNKLKKKKSLMSKNLLFLVSF